MLQLSLRWLVFIAAAMIIIISTCHGAPFRKPDALTLSRDKRGIFDLPQSITTARPHLNFGKRSRRTSTTKRITTTIRTTSNQDINFPDYLDVESSSSVVNSIARSTKIATTTSTTTENTLATISSSSLNPVYIPVSPEALMLSPRITTTTTTTTVATTRVPEEIITTTTTTPNSLHVQTRNLREDKEEDSASNNNALPPTSIWNLIVVLLQLTYSLTQQKVPP